MELLLHGASTTTAVIGRLTGPHEPDIIDAKCYYKLAKNNYLVHIP
jgi:hypothetical protein